MNCLLLGGTGFIGKQLITQRSEWNWTAVGSANVDLSDELDILKLQNNYDIIINAAGFYGGIPFNQKHQYKIYEKNVAINKNVCKLVDIVKPKKFINIGSACIYPYNIQGILQEKDITGKNFHSSIQYSASSKYHMLKSMKLLDVEWEYLILSNVYGPEEHLDKEKSHFVGSLVNKLLQSDIQLQMFGTGIAVRDFLYVKDMSEAVCRYCELSKSTNLPTNISTGYGNSVKEVLEILLKISKKDLQIVWGEENDNGVLHKVLDNKKMLKDINFKPEYNLKTGLQELWQWVINKQ